MKQIDWMRRTDGTRMTAPELKILEAILSVEAMQADPRLTKAVLHLQEAGRCVADFVDGVGATPEPTTLEEIGLASEEVLIRLGLQAMVRRAHRTATNAGWYRDPVTGQPKERNFGEVLALMHSELSEALEADRKDLMDDHLPHRKGVEVEFADALIRICDTAAHRGYDLAGAFIEKDAYNQHRADHKLASRANGGKKY